MASAPPFLCVRFCGFPASAVLLCDFHLFHHSPSMLHIRYRDSLSGVFIFRYYEGFSNLPQLGVAVTPANNQCVTNPLFTRNDETKQISQAKLNFCSLWAVLRRSIEEKGSIICHRCVLFYCDHDIHLTDTICPSTGPDHCFR